VTDSTKIKPPHVTEFFWFFLLCSFVIHAQSSPFLDSLLKTALPTFSTVLEQPNKYKLQVFYTKIDRDADNVPEFKTYKFHSNKNYFYPASTVKLPVGIAAMIKLEELKSQGINKETPMITDSAFYCQKRIYYDTTSAAEYWALYQKNVPDQR
jgi:hypothetical protein